MLNHDMDSVVLVKGWKKGANWSFPRGKISKDEDDLDCAVREVYEETGFNIREAGLVPQPEEVKYIDIPMRDQHIRLYVFKDVPMDTHFEPRTRKEISKIAWYKLSDLPTFKKKGQQLANDLEVARNANKFYMVAPFLIPLKKWIQQKKRDDTHRYSNNQNMSSQYVDDVQTEEEGFRSTAEAFDRPSDRAHTVSAPGLDTLEGATAALHRLLKIQPPTQGLQDTTSAAPSPVGSNTGNALLAILRGKPSTESRPMPPHLPHTPVELTANSSTMPRNPHHQYSTRPGDSNPSSSKGHQGRNGNADTVGGHSVVQPQHGPPFPQLASSFSGSEIQQVSNPTPHNPQSRQFNPIPSAMASSGGPKTYDHFPLPQVNQSGPVYQNPLTNQPQFLRHPQPLPPQVQPGVFTGGQVHSPMVPPHIMEENSQEQMLRNSQGHPMPNNQPPQPPQHSQLSGFQNVHGPALPQVLKPTPPQLTSHSLSLLQAFRNQDQALLGASTPSDNPLTRFTQGQVAPRTQVQDLPDDTQFQQQSHLNGFKGNPPYPASHMTAQEKLPPNASTNAHKSSLLSLFKSPPTASASLAKTVTSEGHASDSPALQHPPQKVSPSSGSNLKTQPIFHDSEPNKSRREARVQRQSQISESSLPFKPTAILTRPPQASSPQGAQTARRIQGGTPDRRSRSPKRPDVHDVKSSSRPAESIPQTNKPFAPQILKRPTSGHPQQPLLMASELTANSSVTASPVVLPHTTAHRVSEAPQPAHKAALLSLFKSPEMRSPGLAVTNDQARIENSPAPLPASRPSSARKPISSTDKGFLLGYLDTIAKGGL